MKVAPDIALIHAPISTLDNNHGEIMQWDVRFFAACVTWGTSSGKLFLRARCFKIHHSLLKDV